VASRLLRWCSPHKAAHGVGHDQHFGDGRGVDVDEIELVHPFTGVRRAGRSLDVAGRRVRPCAGKHGARFVVIALAAYLLWSGPHLIFHAARQHADSAPSVAYGSGAGAVAPRGR
jgi:hypothetical protein